MTAPNATSGMPNLGTIVPKGAAFHVNGVWLFVPDAATSRDIYAACELLDLVANERWVAETSTEIMGT